MGLGTNEELRELDGTFVDLRLTDGSAIEHALLVSAGRGPVRTVWVYAETGDVFVPRAAIADLRPRAA